jgi:drug/metabolite transporter (DMT)-like permease
MRRTHTSALAYIGLVYVAFVWGLNTVAVKHAIGDVNPLAFTALRFILMAPLTIALALASGESLRFARKDLPMLIACGACGYGLYQYVWVLGLYNTTAFASSLLITLTPIITLAIVAVLGHERVRSIRWFGAALALFGVAIFEGAFSGAFAVRLGDSLTLISAAIFAIYTIVSARLLNRYSPLSLLAITMTIGACMIVPGMLPALLRADLRHLSALDWAIYAYSVVFPIVLTYPVWSYGITRIGAARTSLFQFLVPIIAGILSVPLLHATIAPYQIAGALVCIGGMTIAQVLGRFSLTTWWLQRTSPIER